MKNDKRSNAVRIIGGKFRGRMLHFSDIPGLRPTPDRVRETLFNWLMHEIRDSVVLDLFSGSGALGIEALSRGAKKVIFVEKESVAVADIEAHLKQFKVSSSAYECYREEALRALQRLSSSGEKYGLIFLDPPFDQGLLAHVLPACLSLVAEGGKIYIEQESNLDPATYLPAGWIVLKDKIAGEVRYLLIEKPSA